MVAICRLAGAALANALGAVAVVAEEVSPFFRYEPELKASVVLDFHGRFRKGAPYPEEVRSVPYSPDATYRVLLRDAGGTFWRYSRESYGLESWETGGGWTVFPGDRVGSRVREVAPNRLLSWGGGRVAVLEPGSDRWQGSAFVRSAVETDGRGKKRVGIRNWSRWAMVPGGGLLVWYDGPSEVSQFLFWDGETWEALATFHGLRSSEVSHIRFTTENGFVAFGTRQVWWVSIEGASATREVLPMEAGVVARSATHGGARYDAIPLFECESEIGATVPFFSHFGIGEINDFGAVRWLVRFRDDMDLRTRYHENTRRSSSAYDRFPAANQSAGGARWFIAGSHRAYVGTFRSSLSSFLVGYSPGQLQQIDLPVPSNLSRVLGVGADDRLYLSHPNGYFSVDPRGVKTGPPMRVTEVPWPVKVDGTPYNGERTGNDQVDRVLRINAEGIPCRNLESPTGNIIFGNKYRIAPNQFFNRPSHRWVDGAWKREWTSTPYFTPMDSRYRRKLTPPLNHLEMAVSLSRQMKAVDPKLERQLKEHLVTHRRSILDLLLEPEADEWGHDAIRRFSPSTLYCGRGRGGGFWLIDASGCHPFSLVEREVTFDRELAWFREGSVWTAIRIAQTESERSEIVHRVTGRRDGDTEFEFGTDERGVHWRIPLKQKTSFVELGTFAEPDLGELSAERTLVHVDRNGWFYVLDGKNWILEARRGSEVLPLELHWPEGIRKPKLKSVFVARSPFDDVVVVSLQGRFVVVAAPDHPSSPWKKIAVQIRHMHGQPTGFDRDGNLWLKPDDRTRVDFMVRRDDLSRLLNESLSAE